MRHLLASVSAAALVAAGFITLAPTASAEPGDPVSVEVVHAIPGAIVDVYILDAEGEWQRIIDDFEFGETFGPAELIAGDDVRIRVVPGDNDDGDARNPLIRFRGEVPDVERLTLVAALEQGDGPEPVLVPFEDTLEPTCNDEADVVLRHTAPIPPVDVYADEVLVSEELAFGEEFATPIPADTEVQVDVTVNPDPIEDAAISAPLSYPEGVVAYLYAVVDPETGPGVLEVLDTIECTEPTPEPSEEPSVAAAAAEPVPTAVPAGAEPVGSNPAALWFGAALVALFVAVVVGILRRDSAGS